MIDIIYKIIECAEFQIFDCSREISPNLYFHRLLMLTVSKISAKSSIEVLYLMTLRSDGNFEKKLICCFKNDKNLVNFDFGPLGLIPFVQSI